MLFGVFLTIDGRVFGDGDVADSAKRVKSNLLLQLARLFGDGD